MAQDIYSNDTWYEATAKRGDALVFTGSATFDVCIIGGGLAGLTTALQLARKGKRVALVEARRVGAGASGRNGGFVSNGFARGLDEISYLVGLDATKGLHRLSRDGADFVRKEIADGDPTIKMGEGMIVGVRHDDGGELQRYGEGLAQAYGENVHYLATQELRPKLQSERYHGALYFSQAFHIHPLRYCLLLLKKIQAAGGMIYENSPVRRVEKSGNGFVVKMAQGEIRCEHVVHCVSSLGRDLHGPSGRAVLPVATYIAVTEPAQQMAIKTTSAVADTRRAGDYYRIVDGGRILWGGRITTRVSAPARLAEEMRGDMVSTYPQLQSLRMQYAWAGLMGYALHKMPLIGRDNDGRWFATAFGGHGLNTTAMAGTLIASAIAGEDDSYRQFAPFAPKWAFGQLGRLGVQGSYWWMQLRDKLDESRRKPKQ